MLKHTTIRKIGETEIRLEWQAESEKEFFEQMAFITNLPTTCGKCGSHKLKFDHRTPENKQGSRCDYYEINCMEMKCLHTLHFGISAQKKGSVFAKTWEPPHESKRLRAEALETGTAVKQLGVVSSEPALTTGPKSLSRLYDVAEAKGFSALEVLATIEKYFPGTSAENLTPSQMTFLIEGYQYNAPKR